MKILLVLPLADSKGGFRGGGGGCGVATHQKHLNFERLTHNPHSQKNTFQTWL